MRGAAAGPSQVLRDDASDGNKWEYGVPFSRSSGRFTFEEIDVLAMDFGDEFAEELSEKLDAVMEKILSEG